MMTNKEKFDYIIDQMVVMGETGHMKTLPYLNVNHFARDIIRDEGVTPGELTDRIKQGLVDAGVKDMFDEKIVEQLMGNDETSPTIPTSNHPKRELQKRKNKTPKNWGFLPASQKAGVSKRLRSSFSLVIVMSHRRYDKDKNRLVVDHIAQPVLLVYLP